MFDFSAEQQTLLRRETLRYFSRREGFGSFAGHEAGSQAKAEDDARYASRQKPADIYEVYSKGPSFSSRETRVCRYRNGQRL
jgi:hypothetical protein